MRNSRQPERFVWPMKEISLLPGTLAFADGHAERHKWRDKRTTIEYFRNPYDFSFEHSTPDNPNPELDGGGKAFAARLTRCDLSNSRNVIRKPYKQ